MAARLVAERVKKKATDPGTVNDRWFGGRRWIDNAQDMIAGVWYQYETPQSSPTYLFLSHEKSDVASAVEGWRSDGDVTCR
jgi:hypothetical protein